MSKRTRAVLGGTGVFQDQPPDLPAAPQRTDREGMVMMPFWVSIAARRQLKMMAVEEDTTQQQLMRDALNQYFQRRGRPPIA